MKISYIIPAHNEEAYLPRCLEALTQHIEKFPHDAEIIVVNNASTDHTREVALAFLGVRVIEEPKLGSSQARHAGFLHSNGELVANIDADTIIPDNWSIIVRELFDADSNLISITGPCVFFDLPGYHKALLKIFYIFSYLAYVSCKYFFDTGSLASAGNMVIKRTALEKIGGYDAGFTFFGDDTDISRRLHEVGKVIFTFKLVMNTSARRFNKEGFLLTNFRYSMNFLWALIFKKPFTKIALHVR
ncbi:MAG: glycosyltransferase family A protein [Patescibacteria group bacterium]